MPKVTTSITNFTAGELSPKLLGRFDIAKYFNATKTLVNMLILQAGGGQRRPGTKFVAGVKSSAVKVRLVPFVFSTSQAYVIEFGNLHIRFYTNNAQLLIGVVPVEVVTPYLEAELFELQFAQTADILYIVHKNHAPRILQRTSATTFTLTPVTFLGGPFLDDNTTAVTITPSADAGPAAITLTASVATFNVNHEGAFWKIKDGYVKITAYTNPTTVTAEVQPKQDGTAGGLGTGPAATTDWAEGAWSDDEGYPSAVSFHEQRLLFAATANSPQSFWGSFVRVFEDFFPGVDASDAYRYSIATRQVNAIRWLSSGAKSLQLGTSGGTFSASSGTDNVPITPTNIVVQKDTGYGSAFILPERIGNFVYYVQRNLKTMRELGFSVDVDTQQSLNMTLLSDHIANKDGFTQITYQQSPNNMLWCVRADGQIATLTRQIDQQVIGWARQIIGGTFNTGQAVVDSVAVIPNVSGGDDQVWVSVKRTIGGNTVRYIEFFMPETFDDQHDAFFVDSGLSLDSPTTMTAATNTNPVVVTAAGHGLIDGDQIKIVDVVGMTELNNLFFKVKNVAGASFELTNTSDVNINGTAFSTYVSGGEVRKMVTTISGLIHLEGETVHILADGAVRPTAVVAAGAITLASSAAVVHVGLPFTPKIKGLPLSDGSATGTGQGKDRYIYRVTARFWETLGVQYGREGNTLNTIIFRNTSDPLDRPPPLFTGDMELAYPAGWDRAGEYFIQQTQPLPMTVLAVIIRSTVSDK